MSIFVIVLHVVVCVALIMIVLLQTGKGADMGAAFGGGGSQTLFGSLGLAYMSGHQVDSSVVTGTQPAAQTEPAPDSGTVPVAPAPPGTATEQPEAPAPKE
jgi:preprotein translocase subunit SecG